MKNIRSKITLVCETLRIEFQASSGQENFDVLHRPFFNNTKMESLILITSGVSAGYDNRLW
jgi:hypothetical protein